LSGRGRRGFGRTLTAAAVALAVSCGGAWSQTAGTIRITATEYAIDSVLMPKLATLLREYPDSTFSATARDRIRQLTDLLAEHEFGIGYFYMRKGSPAAALERFVSLEQRFPDYSARAKLFFYQAQVLKRLGRTEEASRYVSRLVEEYPDSEWARKARNGKIKPPASASVDTRGKSE